MTIEALGNGAMLHEKVLLDGRGGDLNVERLILDENLGSMAGNEFSHHFGPSLDEPVLIVGCFYAVEAHELLNDRVNPFGVAFSHTIYNK